ncbi:probable LRR receptor-like serine threonine-kinase At2g16250 [Olea europaea subsp. europaea]|uniref:Probable LRR receptor-like serine threonine-kinase At2g16250 n=1 Tax=Olea europaea subsp. europaea TaxID=158383 RepID=A0A8S0RP74_OLEEU|nr:probable LRR receptor-like serine threonine-kinase At2g16250 [Olea europaea subsp. europaea]
MGFGGYHLGPLGFELMILSGLRTHCILLWLQCLDHCAELITNIVDPSSTIEEDLLEDVWAMKIVASSCFNPKSTRRPLMRYILKALENPMKVVEKKNQDLRGIERRPLEDRGMPLYLTTGGHASHS